MKMSIISHQSKIMLISHPYNAKRARMFASEKTKSILDNFASTFCMILQDNVKMLSYSRDSSLRKYFKGKLGGLKNL